jgi:hypothetical protein
VLLRERKAVSEEENNKSLTREDIERALNKIPLGKFYTEYQGAFSAAIDEAIKRGDYDPRRGFKIPPIKPEDRNPNWSQSDDEDLPR